MINSDEWEAEMRIGSDLEEAFAAAIGEHAYAALLAEKWLPFEGLRTQLQDDGRIMFTPESCPREPYFRSFDEAVEAEVKAANEFLTSLPAEDSVVPTVTDAPHHS